jgi:hypothetical protein
MRCWPLSRSWRGPELSVVRSFCTAWLLAGSRPGGRITFFASPKKVIKERRPDGGGPAEGRTALRCSVLRGRAELTSRPVGATFRQAARSQFTMRADARAPQALRSSTPPTGTPFGSLRIAFRSGAAKRPALQARGEASREYEAREAGEGFPGPLRAVEQRRAWGGVRSTLRHLTSGSCLSAALAERVASSARHPKTEQRRVVGPRPTERTGCPFFCLLFFGQAKKRRSPAGANSRQAATQ